MTTDKKNIYSEFSQKPKISHKAEKTRGGRSFMKEGVRKILEKTKQELKPSTDEEVNEVTAKWLFGKHAPKMLQYAPWSFILLKIMWKKGEEPWKTR